ncbi:MAG: hypothetical protein C7B46_08215 [Sulfobacillus benefaciens]|uniref:HTH marR-type domain-containing protein n=1 Tax=Sulfobacillus benefaciens TaxID=453960 RepID=A0A2T2XH41_9FIRM|nr:MAG: hypothetical protein C7B46_08215 [Sulfobacillus benefaciens]
MELADLYYVARRAWLESCVVSPEASYAVPVYERIVMREIGENPGHSIRGIARTLGLPQSMVSKAVKHGIGQGQIYRVTDSRDRRLSRLEPSAKWAQTLATALTISESDVWHQLFGTSLSETDGTALHQAFTQLHQFFKSQETEARRQ